MDVFDLSAKITLDSSAYEQGLTNASKKTSGFGSKVKNGLGVAAKVGATAMAALATGVAAVSTTLVNGVSGVAEYGDHIDKMSQKMGLSATAYQEWDAVMQHCGTTIESVQAGMRTLSNAVETGNEAFEKLGMSQEEVASMSKEDLFSATITALQNVENETERTYLASQLLGRGSTELGALLNMTAGETQQLKDRVHELGGVLSDEAVKAAAKYQDSLQDMRTAFSGLKNNLMSEFLPGFTMVIDGLTDVFTGGGTEKITEGIGTITDKISEELPKVMDVASDIILKLADSIVDNLPKLVGAAKNVVFKFVDYILKNLDKIVEVALQIILELVDGITKALPKLIPAAVDAILKIVDTIIDNLDLIIDAAIELIMALNEGIIAATPKLIEKIPELVVKLVSALIKNAPKLLKAGVEIIVQLVKGLLSALGKVGSAVGDIFKEIASGIGKAIKKAYEWGKDLIKNFIEGIKKMFSKVGDVFKSLGEKIKSLIGFSEPEEGPLSNFHTFAPDMMKLYAQGIRDNKHLLTDAVEDSFNLNPTITRTVNTEAEGEEIIVPQSGNSNGGSIQTAVLEIDRTAFAKLIYKLGNEETSRVGVKLAGVTY